MITQFIARHSVEPRPSVGTANSVRGRTQSLDLATRSRTPCPPLGSLRKSF